MITAGGTLGILIPPSVTMIVYGMATETSIGKLFIAGIVPGPHDDGPLQPPGCLVHTGAPADGRWPPASRRRWEGSTRRGRMCVTVKIFRWFRGGPGAGLAVHGVGDSERGSRRGGLPDSGSWRWRFTRSTGFVI
ncbi:MAG: TRAP transporter large permease subunit [Deltaproteobacteria bacterium]|nr:TRAP transporter large permease subunit [Deltaproteobacteria bacterium]